jgi:hypothetical protein
MEEAPPWYMRRWEDKRRERLTALLGDAGIPRTRNPRDDVEGFYISPAAAEGGYLYRVAYCVPDALPDATERRASGIARCEAAIRAALYSVVESGAPEEAFFTVYVDGGEIPTARRKHRRSRGKSFKPPAPLRWWCGSPRPLKCCGPQASRRRQGRTSMRMAWKGARIG